MSKLGFQTHTGELDERMKQVWGDDVVGRLALLELGSGDLDVQLTQMDAECPLCHDPLYWAPLHQVQGVIGRIVAVEGDKVAVDKLPADTEVVMCTRCDVSFYAKRE